MTIEIKQSSTTYPLVFLMVDDTDHVTGKTGLTPTVTLSKAGAAFGAAAGAVTELANGWYKVAGNATDNNTLGPLILHATGTDADPTDVVFNVSARLADDLAYPTVSGRSLDVSATGEAGIDWANIGSPTTAVNLSATNIDVDQVVASVSGAVGSVTGLTAATVHSDLDDIQTRLPAALVSGRMDSSVGAMAANVLTATAIAADAITDAKVASDVTIASVTGAVGSVTGNVGGNVTGSVGSVTGLTAATVHADLDDIQARLPAALVGGRIDANVGAISADATAADNLEAALDGTGGVTITAALTGNITGNLSGSVGSVTGNVGGNVTGSVGSVATGGIAAASFSAGAIDAAAIATDALGALELAAGAASEIASAVRTELTTELGRIDAAVSTRATAADLATVAGYLDTEIAAILADTNELQTDWANGGRLDNILDARASQTSVDDLPTNAELATALGTADDAVLAAIATVDTVVDAIKATTDKLDDTLEDDAGTYRFTENALEESPTGGSAPSAADIADAVWEEAIADHSGTSGSTAEALAAAGSAGDPWSTTLPGAYGAGTAGKIIGDNINATISSRATQTSVDDLPTNAELATALAGADDAVLAILGTPAGASLSADVAAVKTQTAAIETDTQDIQSRLPAALVSGRIDASVGAMAANVMTAAAAAADLTTELQTGLATAANLATVAAYIDTEVASILAAVDTEVAAIKAKTDNLPSDPADASDVAAAVAAVKLYADRTVVRGTASGVSVTSITTSAFAPSGAAVDQFKGRVVVFDNDTTTAALRGQASLIESNTADATPTLTVTALTTAPAAGDSFSVL